MNPSGETRDSPDQQAEVRLLEKCSEAARLKRVKDAERNQKEEGRRETKTETRHSPSSLHSSGGFAFLASRGSSHDVVLVLWL